LKLKGRPVSGSEVIQAQEASKNIKKEDKRSSRTIWRYIAEVGNEPAQPPGNPGKRKMRDVDQRG